MPEDIYNMNNSELTILADEIRDFLVNSISKTGGHLASNLGVVELTIALMKVFNFEKDKIVWDVGHQSYVYKMLTGRSDQFSSLRKLNGLSGFPKVDESKYDFFNTGHSSNSISTVAGMATGRDLKGENYNVIGVIGDGSLTGGMAYEGLNNLGESERRAIIILNDNGMSIGENTGSVNNHLSKIRTSSGYANFKHGLRDKLNSIPKVGNSIYKGLDNFKDTVKKGLVKGTLFEELGFTYLGPIDGHNIDLIIKTLELAKQAKEPCLIHILTHKGKGYIPAEIHPDKFHGTPPFDIETGLALNKSTSKSYSDIFGNKLVDMAIEDKRIVAVSAAMVDGTGLNGFKKVFPDRIFDVGIAEQHAITFSAGMAKEGARPFVAIYSSFLQRGYDQIIMDIILQKAPVVLCIDRAGCVGADGETHHGIFDISFLNHMPDITIFTPTSKESLEEAMEKAVEINGPVAIRYPRGKAIAREILDENNNSNCEIEIFAVGNMYSHGLKAKELLSQNGVICNVNPVEIVKPISEENISKVNENTKIVVTIEDNVVAGGFGQSFMSELNKNGYKGKIANLGWEKEFVKHGTQDELFKIYNLDGDGISKAIMKVREDNE